MKMYKWNVIEEKWIPMNKSDVKRIEYEKVKMYDGDKWVPMIDLVEDDTNETENSDKG